jgi:hypothetical protein
MDKRPSVNIQYSLFSRVNTGIWYAYTWLYCSFWDTAILPFPSSTPK